MFDPLDAVLWSASGDRGITHNAGSFGRALLGAWVETKDDWVTGLHRDERLEDDGRGWVGDRGNTADDADWFGNLGDAGDWVFLDNANGLGVAHIVDDVFAGE